MSEEYVNNALGISDERNGVICDRLEKWMNEDRAVSDTLNRLMWADLTDKERVYLAFVHGYALGHTDAEEGR